MAITKKHIILAAVVTLAFSLYSFANAKKNQAMILLEKLIWKVGVPKRVRIADSSLKFDIDFTISNPTSEDFNVSTGGMVQARGFRVYHENKLLTSGNLGNIYQVVLRGFSNHTFKDIQVDIPLIELAGIVANIISGGQGTLSLISSLTQSGGFDNLVNSAKNINWQQELKRFSFEIDIQGFGQTYTHRQQLS